jgi:serine/threonine protein kinase
LTGRFTRQDFLSEVYVWKLFNDKGEDELHLSPLLCTFEKPIGDSKSCEYFLLLPWASGDLRQLWENIESPNDRYSACWMVEQCWRLAEALSVIHQDKEERNPIKADGYEDQLYSRHGDIKPGNILWFDDYVGCEGTGTLVLADFGISKSHSSLTKSMSDPEKTKSSPTYKAPEFDSKGKLKIGRKSDIWGLACTWIEFATWHVKGWQAVNDDFPNRRDEADPAHENISQDMFFSVKNGVAIVKPGVLDWIKELHEDNRCSPFIRDFLSFIQEKMLLVDPMARATAGEVSMKMNEFLRKITSNSTYANPPLP